MSVLEEDGELRYISPLLLDDGAAAYVSNKCSLQQFDRMLVVSEPVTDTIRIATDISLSLDCSLGSLIWLLLTKSTGARSSLRTKVMAITRCTFILPHSGYYPLYC